MLSMVMLVPCGHALTTTTRPDVLEVQWLYTFLCSRRLGFETRWPLSRKGQTRVLVHRIRVAPEVRSCLNAAPVESRL
jgi:hypothetical protein